MSALRFELLATDGAARRGRLTTAHGVVDTPAFMPVGTRATVKSLSPDDVRAAGAQIVLGNTFHLLVRPGPDLIRELGGLHRFMSWDGPILTDSGGFQVFSLARLRKVTEEGVEFRAPADGSTHQLSPERAIAVQHALGADVIHPLDECLGYPATRPDTERSLGLTLRWARRSLDCASARWRFTRSRCTWARRPSGPSPPTASRTTRCRPSGRWCRTPRPPR